MAEVIDLQNQKETPKAVSHRLINNIIDSHAEKVTHAIQDIKNKQDFQISSIALSRNLYEENPEVWKRVFPDVPLDQMLEGTITHHIDRMAYYFPHHINRTEPIFDSREDIAKMPSVQLGWYEFDLSTAQEILIEEIHGRIEPGRKTSSWKKFLSRNKPDYTIEKVKKIKITKHGLTEEGRRVFEAYNDIKRTY